MLEGYEKTDFMTALKSWDALKKKVICVYRSEVFEFTDTFNIWRSDFKVHGGMILDGVWYVEK